MRTAPVGPEKRAQILDRLATRRFDLLVVGGGITGAGIALDAATRGLAVALVEKGDFASGTSSKSSKLVHGGLRYLEHRELSLIHESATERDLLRRIAPHLVTPVGFFWPRWAGANWKAGAGLWAYDLLAGFRNVARHRRLAEDEAARLIPGTNRRGTGYLFYDAQTDDARLVLTILQTAQRAGAVVCNYLEVDGLVDVAGRVVGCEAVDAVGGERVQIRAGDVINATGVWADEISMLEDPVRGGRLRPSKGIHIVVSRKALPLQTACLIPTPERRLVFATPWRSSVIVGTTDTEYDGPLDHPSVTPDEAALMLATLSRNFDRSFGPEDLVGAYAGLRPLLADARYEETRDLSRHHAVFRGPRGLLTMTGGKLTTYRAMAEQAVDIVTRRQGRSLPCLTRSIRLGITDLRGVRRRLEEQALELDLPPEVTESLLRSYGDSAPAVLDLARETELAAPIADGLPYLEAELVWGVRAEMATTLSDVLWRRTRLALEDRAGGLQARERLASLAAVELGVPEEQAGSMVAAYEAELGRERGPALPLPAAR